MVILKQETTGGEYSSLGRPNYREETSQDHQELVRLYSQEYPRIKEFPSKSSDEIQRWQFKKIQELVKHAYETVSLYHRKYDAVGFCPADLKTWEDFEHLPILTKEELIEGWPNEIIAKSYDTEFTTRSSGSSGRFVTLAVDKDAVMVDTILGCRQLDMQSSGMVGPHDSTLLIYTCPWWFTSIGGLYQTIFLSTSENTKKAEQVIHSTRPAAISLYPSYLRQLYSSLGNIERLGVKLIITHSEQSTKLEREKISKVLGIPVLDEYSSEELTRIALECPGGSYHLEDDACYIEIVDNKGKILPDNRIGEVIGTNLLNRATPLIRYQQGDLASLVQTVSQCNCGSNFRRLSEIVGRKSDCLTTPKGKIIPSGTLMDLAYRWFLDLEIPIHGLQYEIIQYRPDYIQVFLAKGKLIHDSQRTAAQIRTQLEKLFENECHIEVSYVDGMNTRTGKHRPIRNEQR